jgi:hypothetical protein
VDGIIDSGKSYVLKNTAFLGVDRVTYRDSRVHGGIDCVGWVEGGRELGEGVLGCWWRGCVVRVILVDAVQVWTDPVVVLVIALALAPGGRCRMV